MFARPLPILRRIGFTAQVAKTALASGLSWWAAITLVGGSRPYFAALAAILTVQATVAESVSRGSQRVLGVVGGVVLSMLVVHWFGRTSLSVTLLVLIGMASATALGFGPQAVSQVAISALMILSLGGTQTYAAARLVDTAIGAAVGILVSAVVVPPDATPVAARHAAHLGDELASTLERLAGTVPDNLSVAHELESARTLTQKFEATRAALREAQEGLQYTPLPGRRRRLGRLAGGIQGLEHATMQVRGIVRSLSRLQQVQWSPPESLMQALNSSAGCVRAYGRVLREPREPDIRSFSQALREARCHQRQCCRLLPQHHDPYALSEFGSILADLSKLSDDLEDGCHEVLHALR